MAKAVLNGQEIFGNIKLGEGGGGSTPTITFSIYPTTLLSEVYFAKLTGTDISKKYYVFTADNNVNVQLSDLKVWTDTGSNEGYIALVVNDVVVHRYTLRTETYETIQFNEVSLSANDELAVVVGYVGVHSNCAFYMKS